MIVKSWGQAASRRASFLMPAAFGLLGWIAIASANPQNGQVVGGQATIANTAPNTLTINQATPKAAIDWQSFNIAPNETTQFVQPSANAVALNRVKAGDPSVIAGRLTANGQLVLINPSGIVFSKGAQVDVNALLATTTNISTDNFMAGRMVFDQPSTDPRARVVNNGRITVAQKGLAALVAPGVANNGVIAAKLGKVVLAGAETYTLDLYGDGLIQFGVGPAVTSAPLGADGKPVASLVSNTGKIVAPGGTVLLTADAVSGVVDRVVDARGTIAAPTYAQTPGAVTIDAGAGNAAELSGRINVAGLNPGQTGGNATLTGGSVSLASSARIDARGAAGGGHVTVRSTVAGQTSPGQTASDAIGVAIAAGAKIDASATRNGDGGNVSVWSDTTTTFAGAILAKGGPQGGNGGLIETSAGERLVVDQNALVSAAAPLGKPGTWLLDPPDLTIDAAAATAISNALNAGTDVTEQTTASTVSGFGTATSGTGDINVSAAISWTTPNTLTLSAYNNVNVNAVITLSAGTLSLTSNNASANPGAGITVNAPITVSGGGHLAFTTTGNSAGPFFMLGQGSASFASEASNPTLTINGAPYTLVYTATELGNINNNLSGTYAIATSFPGGSHSAPIIGNDATSFGGTLNGLGNTITNVTINSSSDELGLFSEITGTVSNLGAAVNISASNATGGTTGGLAAFLTGTLYNVFTTGTVAITNVPAGGNPAIGGLVGQNGGTISNSYSSAQVTGVTSGAGFVHAGGLVGVNAGPITGSFASGAVTNNGPKGAAGGLVGTNESSDTITASYATGSVTGTVSGVYVGGLIGWDTFGFGTISQAFSTGPVSGSSGSVGGLIGHYDPGAGPITNAYWDTVSSGTSNAAGNSPTVAGVTGLTTAQLSGSLPTGFSSSVWGNVNNQTTPYLLTNPGP
ncbi:MAG TPA: filamentous hemagglutinin N-terminal domain-containing protein, partial [Stellaceae bacterium]|nr:filamentous hemagglutinin N-terminal domain-containing protein [Stellaceae bacterium]